MKIYVRKLFEHDITHEVSVTTEIVRDFFDGDVNLLFEGKNSHQKGNIAINAATDPRFGGDFKTLMQYEGGAEIDDLIVIYKGPTYVLEIINKTDNRYSSFFSLFSNKERHVVFTLDNTSDNSDDNKIDKLKIADNIILYGVPGCGKSYTIKNEYCKNEMYMERVVFHPDYSYSDFVGQILPKNDDGHISYLFIPGPFTKIMKKAVADPDNNYYLIIEELNRGNAPAIFGDIFQLLDRINGESEYGINNADIALNVYGDENHLVKLPKNLFILATMNTADQNVFTLDTAFKRRWRMRNIKNNINDCKFGDNCVCSSVVTWKSFLKTINEKIIELGGDNISCEDKRLGAYFIQENELSDATAFSEKVLMYLWNDAFKYEHDKIFRPQYKTLDQLIDGFESVSFEVFNPKIHFESSSDEASLDNTIQTNG